MSKKEYFRSTLGFMQFHENLRSNKLVRVHFLRNDKGVYLQLVSGHNLARMPKVNEVLISEEEFSDRPHDPYNDTVEANWAFGLLGCE